MRHSLLVFSSFIALSACTQAPANVDMRGTQTFSRNDGGYNAVAYHRTDATFASNTPYVAPANTEQTAKVESIGVSDLAPAPKTTTAAAAPAPAPVAKTLTAPAPAPKEIAKTEEPKKAEPAAKIAEAAPVNQWTHKPRETQTAAAAVGQKFIWPVSSHNVASGFGGKGNDGINITAPQGEPVWASADGEVVYADSKMKGYGNMVLIKHPGGKTTTYAHLARIGVEKYDRVKQGDIIGYVGSTGSVKKPQLYFSMRNGTQAIDPQKYLDRDVAGL